MSATTLYDMFHLALPVGEKILRPIVVYAFLILGLRLAGKRELAQLNPFDLVVLLTISNTVQNAIIGEDNSITGGLIGAATLLVVNHVVVRFLYSHERLDRLLEGAPTPLIERGQLLDAALKRELVTTTEIELAAHRQGFDSLADVETAVLDPGGAINFTRRSPSVSDQRHAEIMKELRKITSYYSSLVSDPDSPHPR